MIGNVWKSQILDRGDPSRGRRVVRSAAVSAAFAILMVIQHTDTTVAVPTFTNVTAAVGITHVHTPDASGALFMSAGAAAADFDGDGLVDLFFTQVNDVAVLYRNTGGGFENVSAAAGFAQVLPTSGVAAGDIDNDGDMDLSLMGMQSSRHYLYINDGTGHFTEDAIARGADVTADEGSPNRRGQGVAFGDYDRDGYLDMMTSDHSKPTATSGSRLLRNLGAANPGHFEDVTHAAGLDVYRPGLHDSVNAYRFQPQFTDIDRDGHTDILIVADERTSQLFWNNGDGTFTDGTVPAGVGTDKSGMGSALGDYDRDGDLDWFITAIFDTPFLGVNPGNRLFRNNGNRTFTDVTTAAGVRNSGTGQELSWGWGTTFFDYDNDADQDLVMTNGFVALGYSGDHTTLRRNNGDGTFTNVSAASGVTDTGQGRGLLRLDYDTDGDLDVLVVNYGAAPILYRNDGGNEANWLRVKTEGTFSNRDGIGALITVVPDVTSPLDFQIWEIGSGSSYLSQEEMTAHFGLGSLSGTVDQVTVEWTSGLLQTYVDVSINSLLMAQERLLGDYNGDSVVDAADYTVWRDAVGMAGVGLAADGAGPNGLPDGVVDQLDYLSWKANFGQSYEFEGMAEYGEISGQAALQVPEPASLYGLIIVAVGAINCRRRAMAQPRNGHGSVGRRSMTRLNWLIYSMVFAVWCGSAARSVAVDVWVTTGDKTQLLKQQTDVLFQSGSGSGGTAISVIPSTTFQTISGFGASMTDSSAWLMENELTAPQRDKLMRQLFSPQSGIGLNYLRVPIGASDFTATGFYTYNDNPPGGSDPSQQHFSISHDEAYIIPRLQQARALNPELKLMASPWSAPAWMKTNNSLTGGSLAPQWEAAYARYLAKFVQAYEAEGLPIDTLTLQNEPLHTTNYPTMSMTAAQQISLIKNHVGPLFAAEDISSKLLAYDHNWDNTAYPIEVLNDPDARQYVAGTAFHAYAGSVSAQTTVHNAHPDKDVYFTEITGGDWATNFADNLVWNFQNILIGNTRNWGKTALFWNLALDQNNNPHLNGCSDCRGVVTINNSTGAITFNEEFYALGQVTKVVQPGAIRVNSTTNSTLNTVAFLNPNGSRVLIALNPNSSAATARVFESDKHFNFQVPGKSVATFLWNEPGADFDNGGFDDGGFQLGGGSLDAWTAFGDATGNVSAASESVLSGEKSLKLFGQFSGSANVSGLVQGITVAPGDELTATLSAFVRTADSIAGTNNHAQLKIEYYNQHGAAFGSPNFLGEDQLLIADASTTNDVWTIRQLTGVAPAGAVEARLVLQFVQPNNQIGAVHIDNVAFGISGAMTLTGDYDASGVVDEADYLVWKDSFGSAQSNADGNGDGTIDAADYTIWRDNFGASLAAQVALSLSVPEPPGMPLALGGLLGMMGLHLRTAHPEQAAIQAKDLRQP